MIIAVISDWIERLFFAVGGLVTALGLAWVSLRKGNAELKKTDQNGLVSGWKNLAEEHLAQWNAALVEIRELRQELTKVYLELRAARSDTKAHKVEVEDQHEEIRVLEKELVALSKTDPVELAEVIAEVVVDKMAKSPIIVTNKQPDEPCPE